MNAPAAAHQDGAVVVEVRRRAPGRWECTVRIPGTIPVRFPLPPPGRTGDAGGPFRDTLNELIHRMTGHGLSRTQAYTVGGVALQLRIAARPDELATVRLPPHLLGPP